MVRLGARSRYWAFSISYSFQFQYGTIGGVKNKIKDYSLCAISIPVWYDWGQTSKEGVFHVPKFQFQYGTIGGGGSRCISVVAGHISIPVWYDWGAVYLFQFALKIINFNSSMVRLGAIILSLAYALITNFNSSMVRLGA